ncbi:SRPBCC domain-containing protein [Nocardia concava]|uniref:SRPBCC domain-containing protein n=1 Tax=Nocardia concava TaxID=257281 RepID=UPI00059371B4|nr:SRPBCC domain-containing protein [Nocardia concava]
MAEFVLTQAPVAYACMIVRTSAGEAFRAFADPAVTSRFWYSKSSGPMTDGATLRWEWETYGAATDVRVERVEQDRLIRFQWGNYEQPTTVEIRFTPHATDATFVEVTESGFHGSGDAAIGWVNDSVGEYTSALCGMKALLEHGIELNATGEHHPA